MSPKRKIITGPVTTAPAGIIQQSDWRTEYTGYGSVNWSAAGVSFAPKQSTQPSETHAALLLRNNTSLKDFTVKIKAKTVKQLRVNSPPNPWECFWFLFNYTIGADGKKTANYLTLKPNGLEIGTMNAEIGQTFLYTAATPKLTLGVFNNFQITKAGASLSASIDGDLAVVLSATGLYDQAGTFGIYSEDAEVLVESVVL